MNGRVRKLLAVVGALAIGVFVGCSSNGMGPSDDALDMSAAKLGTSSDGNAIVTGGGQIAVGSSKMETNVGVGNFGFSVLPSASDVRQKDAVCINLQYGDDGSSVAGQFLSALNIKGDSFTLHADGVFSARVLSYSTDKGVEIKAWGAATLNPKGSEGKIPVVVTITFADNDVPNAIDPDRFKIAIRPVGPTPKPISGSYTAEGGISSGKIQVHNLTHLIEMHQRWVDSLPMNP